MSTRLRWSDRPLDRWDRLVDPGQISTRPLDLGVSWVWLGLWFCLVSPSDDVLRILCKTRYVVCCGDTLVPLTTLFWLFCVFCVFCRFGQNPSTPPKMGDFLSPRIRFFDLDPKFGVQIFESPKFLGGRNFLGFRILTRFRVFGAKFGDFRNWPFLAILGILGILGKYVPHLKHFIFI